ncbi:MAG TPA: CAP domain-containing protein [Polyangiaceae bacterium]|nr:CAP domain-containing protein [Polyangiaceae bacterium]
MLGVLALASCAAGTALPPEPLGQAASSDAPPPQRSGSIIAGPESVVWARQTESPRWETGDARRLPTCVAHEEPLTRVARTIAEARLHGAPATDMKDVVVLLRSLGSPHVWPRIWVLEAQALSDERLLAEWSSWIAGAPSSGQRRCGVARVDAGDGRSVAVAVVADALADLAALPLQARLGQWLRVDAQLLAAARSAQLLVLGPDEMPRRVPSRLEAGAFHATLSVDQPGFWRLQVLLDVGFGPQPALEAWVFVDGEPELDAVLRAAPGEQPAPEGAGREQLRAALSAMIDAGRRSQGLHRLVRDDRLDALAQAHADAMQRVGRTAHDVGDGTPIDRVARVMPARRVGENVARARTLERAHGVLWDSPSHRGNLLDAGFDALGIGVARTDDADVVVCELFVDSGRAVTERPLPPAGVRPPSVADASRSSRPDLVRGP